jgi:putative ABC transport system permease protein
MLMAMREQSNDIGILKALGYTDGSMFGLLIVQALFLCVIGGGLGILIAWATQGMVADGLGAMFPGYEIKAGTFVVAAVVSVALGFMAGVVPAWNARRLQVVQALRAGE